MGLAGRRAGLRRALALVVAAGSLVPLAGPPAGVGAAQGLGTPRPFTTTVSSDRGAGRIDPGESCAEGGEGGYWHYDYEAPLAPGVITGPANPLPGSLRLHLDLHSEDHVVRAAPGEPVPGSAWLQGTESRVTLSNQRGTVALALRSVPGAAGASCATARALVFDGLTASGGGLAWQLTKGTGSYRQAAGSGTAALQRADVAPGSDNPMGMSLNGNVAVLQPGLKLEVVDTYWAFLGAHYLKRWVTVIYRVTNTGPGDAFGVRLTGASSPTQGVKLIGPIPRDTTTRALGPVPQHLADVPAGQSEIVRLRWELPNPSGKPPCGLVILGCRFDTTLTFDMPDALDVVQAPASATVNVKAPDFPPPVAD